MVEPPPPYTAGDFYKMPRPPAQGQGGGLGAGEVPYYPPPPPGNPGYPAYPAYPAYPGYPPGAGPAPTRGPGVVRAEGTVVFRSQPVATARFTVIRMGNVTGSHRIKEQMLLSVAICMCCGCWPLSFFAIYFSWKAFMARACQNDELAEYYTQLAKRINIVAAVTGFVIVVLCVTLIVFFIYGRK